MKAPRVFDAENDKPGTFAVADGDVEAASRPGKAEVDGGAPGDKVFRMIRGFKRREGVALIRIVNKNKVKKRKMKREMRNERLTESTGPDPRSMSHTS